MNNKLYYLHLKTIYSVGKLIMKRRNYEEACSAIAEYYNVSTEDMKQRDFSAIFRSRIPGYKTKAIGSYKGKSYVHDCQHPLYKRGLHIPVAVCNNKKPSKRSDR